MSIRVSADMQQSGVGHISSVVSVSVNQFL